jgi:hypothetical protein
LADGNAACDVASTFSPSSPGTGGVFSFQIGYVMTPRVAVFIDYQNVHFSVRISCPVCTAGARSVRHMVTATEYRGNAVKPRESMLNEKSRAREYLFGRKC